MDVGALTLNVDDDFAAASPSDFLLILVNRLLGAFAKRFLFSFGLTRKFFS
jgi:hypothetical protein